jgi:hypothetical protein
LAASANAFSAVAPKTTSSSGPATGGDAIDKTLEGINVGDDYDPTSGDSPPLTRNNHDQVWVPQVGENSLKRKLCNMDETNVGYCMQILFLTNLRWYG